MANTINRYKEVEISGKKYRFQYTIKSLILAEAKLTKTSILATIADPPLSFSDTYALWLGGIVGGGLDASEEAIEQLLLEYLGEHNVGDLQTLILEALVASGTLGKLDTKNA